MKIESKSVADAKDELEFATNWRRVFVEVYQKLKWLNSYAKINEVAIQKILLEFADAHFELKDNIIEKQLLRKVQKYRFLTSNESKQILSDLTQFFADNFTNGNKD